MAIYDITTYGANPSNKDNSTAIQKAIDAAKAKGGGTVLVPAGRYKMSGQIVVKNGVKLQGEGKVCYDWTKGQIYNGSILEINWGNAPGSAGNINFAAVILNGGATVDNMGFDYPSQTPDLIEPIEYGSTIQLADPIGILDCIIINNFFFKSYIAMDLRGSKNPYKNSSRYLTVKNNCGTPLYACIAVDLVADWQTIEDCKFNAGAIDQSNIKCNLTKWISKNGTVLLIGGNDWLQCINIQAWGYHHGAKIMAGDGYQATGPYTFQNCQFDACETTFLLSGKFNMPVKIMNGNFCSFNSVTDEQGITVKTLDNCSLSGLIFENNYIFGPVAGIIDLTNQQASYNVMINNNQAVSSGFGQNAVAIKNVQKLHVNGNIFNNYQGIDISNSQMIQIKNNNLPGWQGINVGNSNYIEITGNMVGDKKIKLNKAYHVLKNNNLPNSVLDLISNLWYKIRSLTLI